MQKHVNLVDLVKSFPTNIFLRNLASIQKRTIPLKFAHLAEKSENGSISNLSTKVSSATGARRTSRGTTGCRGCRPRSRRRCRSSAENRRQISSRWATCFRRTTTSSVEDRGVLKRRGQPTPGERTPSRSKPTISKTSRAACRSCQQSDSRSSPDRKPLSIRRSFLKTAARSAELSLV